MDRFRQPEYTGENRCTPCTVVNTVIAVVVSAAVAVVALWADLGTAVAGGVAVVLFALSLASIYLRGYLVPYTPTLTKRYFPDRVLRWFEHEPPGHRSDAALLDDAEEAPVAGDESELDPEPVLLEAGAIEFCKGGEDLCPTEEFTAAWREEIERLRDGGDVEARARAVVDPEPDVEVAVEEHEDYSLVRAGNHAVARWESYPALLADLAAYPVLAERVEGWDDLDRRAQGSLLNGARVFLEECPRCDGELAFSEDTVESCCRSLDVVALVCQDCDARLIEVET